jgi:hypothetical protein
MCLRSLLSCALTLITTTTNLAVLLGLHGEPAWIFLLCCNVDVVFSVLIRRWVTLKGQSSNLTITSFSPEEIMVNESNAAAPSFSSSQTAQNIYAETIHRELTIDENGKVTETKGDKKASEAEAKDIENGFSLSHLELSAMSPTPPNSLIREESCFSGADLCDDSEVVHNDQEQVETEAERLGRAIITTHISAQKIHNRELNHHGDLCYDWDAEGKEKFGGIRVMIEQVVEVEYESDNGL